VATAQHKTAVMIKIVVYKSRINMALQQKSLLKQQCHFCCVTEFEGERCYYARTQPGQDNLRLLRLWYPRPGTVST